MQESILVKTYDITHLAVVVVIKRLTKECPNVLKYCSNNIFVINIHRLILVLLTSGSSTANRKYAIEVEEYNL